MKKALFPPPMSAHDDEVEEIEVHPPPAHDDDDDNDEEDREEEVDSEDIDDDDDEEEEEEEEEEEVPYTDVPTTAPLYLVYHHGRRECRQSFFSISEGIHFVKSVPEMNGMTCCASCEGWLVMLDKYYSRRCFLFNPVSMEKVEIPPMKAASNYLYCVLSSSPPDCVVMFLYQNSSCVFCRPNDQRWTRIFLKPRDKEGKISGFELICGAVSYEGKIYISFMNGTGIKVLTPITTNIDTGATRINNRSFTVDKIKIKEDPTDDFDFFTSSARLAFYLIESCGDVLMVVKIYREFDLDIHNLDVYSFTVFKLKYSPSSSRTAAYASWEKVESLGADRVFFLAQPCSVSFSASKLKVKENCIYYSEPDDEHLYAFDMEKQKFYSILPCPHLVGRHTDEPSWMLIPTV